MIAPAPPMAPKRTGSAVAAPSARNSEAELETSIVARPLFAATRRPAAVRAGPVAMPANLPRLAGILVDGDRRSVIFAAGEGGRPVVVHEGAQVGGYIVQSIEAGQVTLSGPNGAQVLRPSFDPRPRDPGLPAGQLAGAAPDILQTLRNLPGFPGAAR